MTSATLKFVGSLSDVWQSQIPEDFLTFQGRTIGIWIESADDGSCPAPEMRALLDQILCDLPSVIDSAQTELSRYENDSEEDYSTHIKNPHIWLTIDLVPNDPTAWTFVVERDDWPDFGWHIEFRGIRFHEIWAGD